MSCPIEDYALIGDTRTAALVAKNGSIDWLCLPRFDSGACFAALLGDARHGRWLLCPKGEVERVQRRYRDDTLVLETEVTCASGRARIVDLMPPGENVPNVVRIVEGLEGRVPMRMELVIRLDYGSIVPWVRTIDGVLRAVAGPDALALQTPVETHGVDLVTAAEFEVAAGDRVPFVLTWYPSHESPPASVDADEALASAESWWRAWASQCTYHGPWRDAVVRSLITLKALTYAPTGGIVAAATTSLPERIGAERNWDYRYCWLRDATFTLYALLAGGFRDEATAWRDWLLRAAAGSPWQLQSLYGVAGERRLPELTLDWLPGYEGSKPVRVGNAAVGQLQLDVYGEIADALYQARKAGLEPNDFAWKIVRSLLRHLETSWREPDEGIWEVRSGREHFTHSKVMCWVAFDRAVRAVERLGRRGPVERWRAVRDEIHAEICANSFDPALGAFTRAYGSRTVDASLLMIPLVGFLPGEDPRVAGTVAAIERELVRDGFVMRYRTEAERDGLSPGEGAFLLCSFWLADNYALMGREKDALALFERLLSLRNDVGLLSEEYDPVARRLLGNFPQAFSHVGMINTAFNLTANHPGPAEDRKTG